MASAFIKGLLEQGTPWAILCLGMAVVIVVLWRRSIQLSDQLFKLATSQVKVNTETRWAMKNVGDTLGHVERDVDDISRRYQVYDPPTQRR